MTGFLSQPEGIFLLSSRYQDDLRRSQPCQSRPVWKEDEALRPAALVNDKRMA